MPSSPITPPPDSVIEIEHEHAAALAAQRADDAHDMLGVKRHQGIRERQFCEIPLGRRVPVGKANRLGDAGDVEQHVGRLQRRVRDLLIDAIDQIAGRAGQRAVEGSEQSFGRRGERLQDAQRAAVARYAGTDRIEKSDCRVNGLGG
ncbi:hypothetical protein MTX20_33720 [Bradyrhizobium sp. ISRA435]|nr:hypothetical protein MTX20_33720 [Bradyrhizobium sp. ISRA435]